MWMTNSALTGCLHYSGRGLVSRRRHNSAVRQIRGCVDPVAGSLLFPGRCGACRASGQLSYASRRDRGAGRRIRGRPRWNPSFGHRCGGRERWRSREPHSLARHAVPPSADGSDEADDAVVEALGAVDHAGSPASGVEDEVEAVPDLFHLIEGLVHGHRFGGVLRVPHDVPGPTS